MNIIIFRLGTIYFRPLFASFNVVMAWKTDTGWRGDVDAGNVYEYYPAWYQGPFEDLAGVDFCLDTGHQAAPYHAWNMGEGVGGAYIGQLHLHDNLGDRMNTPGNGEGQYRLSVSVQTAHDC